MIARKLQWLVLRKAICEVVPTLSKLTPFFFKVKRVKECFFSFRGDRKRKKRVSVLKIEEKVEARFLDRLN
jgi:hypothetical protein